MSTGVPKTKWGSALPVHDRLGANGPGVHLSHEGEVTKDVVLAMRPAQELVLWGDPSAPNRLYYGDNLPILASLMRDASVKDQVRMVYIDPPYSTRSVFKSRAQSDAYVDLLAGGLYIEFLRQRLILLRELLAGDGSIYVHLDDNMAFYIKVIMDEVFGLRNFRNWITRKKCHSKNFTRRAYGNVADYILFYSKADDYVWNRPYEPWNPEHARREYQYIEPETGRRYKKVPVHAPGVRNGETGKPWRGMLPPPGKHWQFPPKTLDEMDARGEIYWSPTGNPRRKIYLDQSQGVYVQDIWVDFLDAHNQNVKITGYPTEKNSRLLSRIIRASSNPGDIVLDCFSGSGTTASVASALGRRWIGVDNSPEAIRATLKRFALGPQRMGDYRQKTVEAEVVSLMPIKDFVLLAAEPYGGELQDTVLQWCKWIEP